MEKTYTVETQGYYTFVVQNPSEVIFELIGEFGGFLARSTTEGNTVRVSFHNYSENDEEIILAFHEELMAQEYKPIL